MGSQRYVRQHPSPLYQGTVRGVRGYASNTFDPKGDDVVNPALRGYVYPTYIQGQDGYVFGSD